MIPPSILSSFLLRMSQRALIRCIYRRCWRSKCQDRVSSSFPSIVGICLPCFKFYLVSPLSECGLLEFTRASVNGLLLLSSLALSYIPFFQERLSSWRWCASIMWSTEFSSTGVWERVSSRFLRIYLGASRLQLRLRTGAVRMRA